MKIVIYGNGAMARVIYSYVRHGKDVCEVAVDDSCIPDSVSTFCGLPLVPFNRLQDVFDPVARRYES